MTRIVAIGGSLRRASLNAGLLRAAAEVAPEGVAIDVHRIDGIPLYDGDAEARDGIPPAAAVLKDALAGADALLIATPEYNNALPGVLKNAIDWMSRPSDNIDRVFAGKPVAVIGASPGGFGTLHAQQAWVPVFRFLKMAPWFGEWLLVSKATPLFDAAGNLTDEDTREKLRGFIGKFAEAIPARANGAAGEN